MWHPNTQLWKCEDISIIVEPYRCDLKVKRDSTGKLVAIDTLAGTIGVLYFIDLTVINHSPKSITLSLSGHKSNGGGFLFPIIIPCLEPKGTIRFRIPKFPGDMLKFGWRIADKSIKYKGIICGGLDSYILIGSDFNVEYVPLSAGQELSSSIQRNTTWKWLLDKTIWNEVDLIRKGTEGTVPIESGLAVASRAIMEELCNQPHILQATDPTVFESLVAAIFHQQGFAVRFTARGRDGGVDLFAFTGPYASPTLHLVQCKRYKHKVGIRAVRELYGVRQILGASKAVLVTPSQFTKPALEFASDHPWEIGLMDWEGLLNCLYEYESKSITS